MTDRQPAKKRRAVKVKRLVASGPYVGSQWIIAPEGTPEHLIAPGGVMLATKSGAPHPKAAEAALTARLSDGSPPARGTSRRRKPGPDQGVLFDEQGRVTA